MCLQDSKLLSTATATAPFLILTPSSPGFCCHSHIWWHSEESCLHSDLHTRSSTCSVISVSTKEMKVITAMVGGGMQLLRTHHLFYTVDPLLQDISSLRLSPLSLVPRCSNAFLNIKSFYYPNKF